MPCPFFRPKMFSPVTVYGTTHAHLVHKYLPPLWGLEIPLQSPSPGGRLSLGNRPPQRRPPHHRRALRGEISRGGRVKLRVA